MGTWRGRRCSRDRLPGSWSSTPCARAANRCSNLRCWPLPRPAHLVSEAEQYPTYSSAPLYIRESLLFPYTEGLLFQQAVVEKHGAAGFTEVFRNPPVSSQQILDPEAYFGQRIPTKPRIPRVRLGRGYKTISQGEVGQWDHSISSQGVCWRRRIARSLAALARRLLQAAGKQGQRPTRTGLRGRMVKPGVGAALLRAVSEDLRKEMAAVQRQGDFTEPIGRSKRQRQLCPCAKWTNRY